MTAPSPSRRTAQAVDALRHGWPVRVSGGDGALLLLPAETGHDAGGSAARRLLISAARAATLKLINQKLDNHISHISGKVDVIFKIVWTVSFMLLGLIIKAVYSGLVG